MTRDELLKEIDFELGLSDYDTWREGAKALRAVVELHKQIDDNSCHHCATWYPCPTIQAIESAVNG